MTVTPDKLADRVAKRVTFEIERNNKRDAGLAEIGRNLPAHTARLERLHRSKYNPRTVGPNRSAAP